MPATTGARSADKAPMDHLQDALEDLDKAREKAGEEVGTKIDSCLLPASPFRDALPLLRSRNSARVEPCGRSADCR